MEISKELSAQLEQKAWERNLSVDELLKEFASWPDPESLRTEYAATQDAIFHYDNYSWQVGVVLIAGVFVYWGFLLDKHPELTVMSIGNLLVCFIMSSWILYTEHNRQIYIFKLHRIHEIETILGLEQHRRFVGKNKIYKLDFPRGHHLDGLIYFLTSLGGPILSIFSRHEAWHCRHTVLIIVLVATAVIVFSWVLEMDCRAKQLVK
jgi:hypothetical protein